MATFQITVSDPATGKSVSWTSSNLENAKNQARIEVSKGADVTIKNELGRIIWAG